MCVVVIEIKLKYNLSKYFLFLPNIFSQYLFKYFRDRFFVPSEYLFPAAYVQIFEQTYFFKQFRQWRHHHQHHSCEEGECNDFHHNDLIMADDCEDEARYYDLLLPGALYTATSPIPVGFNIGLSSPDFNNGMVPSHC